MNPSNTELTPLSFLRRSAEVFPEKVAVVHGQRRLTYRELAAQAQQLARALRASGVRPGDRVAYLMPNVPEMLVAHFSGCRWPAVPGPGGMGGAGAGGARAAAFPAGGRDGARRPGAGGRDRAA